VVALLSSSGWPRNSTGAAATSAGDAPARLLHSHTTLVLGRKAKPPPPQPPTATAHRRAHKQEMGLGRLRMQMPQLV